jgi:hypothetical protein
MKPTYITISNLNKSDIGRWVVYNGGFGEEKGRIKTWNEEYVFVVYKCDNQWDRYQDFTAAATRPEQLDFVDDKDLK